MRQNAPGARLSRGQLTRCWVSVPRRLPGCSVHSPGQHAPCTASQARACPPGERACQPAAGANGQVAARRAHQVLRRAGPHTDPAPVCCETVMWILMGTAEPEEFHVGVLSAVVGKTGRTLRRAELRGCWIAMGSPSTRCPPGERVAGGRRSRQPIWAAWTLTSVQVPGWRPGDALVSVRR